MQRSRQFIEDEIKEIKRYLKEREIAGETVGDDTIRKWVEDGNSEKFQEKWEKDHS